MSCRFNSLPPATIYENKIRLFCFNWKDFPRTFLLLACSTQIVALVKVLKISLQTTLHQRLFSSILISKMFTHYCCSMILWKNKKFNSCKKALWWPHPVMWRKFKLINWKLWWLIKYVLKFSIINEFIILSIPFSLIWKFALYACHF